MNPIENTVVSAVFRYELKHLLNSIQDKVTFQIGANCSSKGYIKIIEAQSGTLA